MENLTFNIHWRRVREQCKNSPLFLYLITTSMRLFTFSSSIFFFSVGLMGPFWVIFLQDFGGSLESLGFSVGLAFLSQSVTSYFSGKYSDKFGRKVFLIGSVVASGYIIIAYTIISSLLQLYVLQILYGMSTAIHQTTEKVVLGDLTKRETRGVHIGKYNALVSGSIGVAMIFGGFLAGFLGIKFLFYMVAILIFLSAISLFRFEDSKHISRAD